MPIRFGWSAKESLDVEANRAYRKTLNVANTRISKRKQRKMLPPKPLVWRCDNINLHVLNKCKTKHSYYCRPRYLIFQGKVQAEPRNVGVQSAGKMEKCLS